MPVTRILVVDDFLSWQRCLLIHFEAEPDFKIIATAADGLDATQKAKELQPDVILMDLSMPGMNGIAATRQIRTISPGSKILFLTEQRGTELIQAAFDVGGSGYVLKSDTHADLIPGIRAVLLGQQFVSQSLRGWLESPGPTD